MKVVGTGAPVMLILRLAPREVEGLRDELFHRRAGKTEAAAIAHERSPGAGAGGGTPEVEDHHEELVVIAGVLDQLARKEPNSAGRIEIVGPTWLLGPSIRAAAVEAGHRLLDALERFSKGRGCTADELRNAMANAAAWSESLLAYDYVDNHAMDS